MSRAFYVLALILLWIPCATGTPHRPICERPEPGRSVAALTSSAVAGQPGDADLREGWPVVLGTPNGGFPYTPMLCDVDHDGADEIFITGGHTFGLRGNGSFLPGWPTGEQPYMGYGTNDQKPMPSAADLEGDGDVEILWSLRDWYAGSAHMWCFNGKEVDGSDLPGFPCTAPDESSNALMTPFVLGDTDGDGVMEAWTAHTLGNTGINYRVTAFHAAGSLLFTVDTDPAEDLLNLYYGDLDGSGEAEIFSVGWLSPSLWLHVYTSDGSEQPGYPIALHTLTSGWLPFGPPVPVDLDDDGDLELLVGYWDGSGSRVTGYHHDGSPLSGFPINIASSSQLFYIALGDVTGDGAPEMIALDNHLGSGYRAFVFDLATGAALPGWPLALTYWPKGYPTIVDVDNDGFQDVCFVTEGGELFAVAGDGQILAGYPKQMVSTSISGVGAGDIDGDGLFELVAATWDGWVYAWDTPGEVLPGRADWPMRGINPRNTGIFGEAGAWAGVRAPELRLDSELRVSPNPVRDFARFSVSPTAPRGPIRLEVFDASGRRVHLGEALQWRPGAAQPAGIYTARMHNRQVRFVLVR